VSCGCRASLAPRGRAGVSRCVAQGDADGEGEGDPQGDLLERQVELSSRHLHQLNDRFKARAPASPRMSVWCIIFVVCVCVQLRAYIREQARSRPTGKYKVGQLATLYGFTGTVGSRFPLFSLPPVPASGSATFRISHFAFRISHFAFRISYFAARPELRQPSSRVHTVQVFYIGPLRELGSTEQTWIGLLARSAHGGLPVAYLSSMYRPSVAALGGLLAAVGQEDFARAVFAPAASLLLASPALWMGTVGQRRWPHSHSSTPLPLQGRAKYQ
jgi:hypothetical protein